MMSAWHVMGERHSYSAPVFVFQTVLFWANQFLKCSWIRVKL